MRQFLFTALLTAGSPTPYPAPPPSECHFPDGAALGCVDGENEEAPANAVTLFESYGTSNQKITQDFVRTFAHRFGCGAIHDQRYVSGLKIQVLGRYRASQPDGLYAVDRVSITAPNQALIFWIDARYLVGSCPRIPPEKGGDPEPNSSSHG